MTDPGERLRSSLAADSRSDGPAADFDSPIAMEALRATRVLHAANQDPFPTPGRTGSSPSPTRRAASARPPRRSTSRWRWRSTGCARW